jgi:hypothetical protein
LDVIWNKPRYEIAKMMQNQISVWERRKRSISNNLYFKGLLLKEKWLDASMVKWTAFDPCEGSTIQGSKLFIKISFFEILFYKMLRNILIYKVQQFVSRKKSSKSLCKFLKMVQVV